MGVRDRLKKTFSRRSSSVTNTTASSSDKDASDPTSAYYKPGEKIPYKYRRAVEPAHKAKLDGFSWTNAWRRRSHQSEYSPMGSRMPSRQGSAVAPPAGVRLHGSVDSGKSRPRDELALGTDHLEPIQSVQTSSEENLAAAATAGMQSLAFSPEQLEAAIKKVHAS
jgi:hypothetical protein